ARLRACPRRNDGGHDGDRQHAAGQAVAVRAPVHDVRRAGQRIHRGRRRPLYQCPDRNRPRAVHHHAHRQHAVAGIHLVARPPAETAAPPHAGRSSGGRLMRRRWRRGLSHLVVVMCALAVLLALVPLALVLFYVVSRGIGSLNWAFFTHMPAPVGESGGGMWNAIVGTLMVTALGAIWAIPIGVVAGIYAAEFRGTSLATAVRFAADTLNGIPSIVIGLFGYTVVVLHFQFSALAGAFALGVMV